MEQRFVLTPGVVIALDPDEERLELRLDGAVRLSTSEVEPTLAALAKLVVPTTRAELAAALPELEVDDLIDALAEDGIVVRVGGGDDPVASPTALTDALSEIVGLAHAIAGEVMGQGGTRARGVTSAHADVHTALLSLLRVQTGLRAARRDHLAGQLARLGVAGQSGLRLHLGAGPRALPGWINVDVAPAELAMDLRWGLPFAAGSADYVFLSHFLEHLSEAEALQLLREVHRVLRVGGVVRVIVPSFRRYAEAYVRADRRFFDTQAAHWPWARALRTDLQRILRYAAGADVDPRTFSKAHRYGYDYETLAVMLGNAGFTHVSESDYMNSVHAPLRIDDQTAYAGVQLDGRHFSLFIEATA